jgi:nucleotide-binding universal stress UspA family protein
MVMTDRLQSSGGVVVGVDGSEQGYDAVRFAAAEAARSGARLELLHVLPARVPAASIMMPTVPDSTFESFGAEILQRGRQVARDEAPGVEVGTHLRIGGRIQELLRYGERASLLVLGSRSPRSLEHIWTGGIITSVSSTSSCPVVVVPADREPALARGRVVVGLKSVEGAIELLGAGFALAEDLDDDLVVLHAWRLEGVYDDIIADRTVAEQWQHDQIELIEQAIVDHRAAFPEVRVRVYVRHEEPAHALVRASRGADRLMLLRPRAGRWPHHLGRVARAVLRDARCPVEVVPAHRGADPDVARGPVEALVP